MANKTYAFSAESRENVGKGAARALRREGKVPAVIYGNKQDAVKITLPSKEVNLEYRKGHMFTTLCDLDVSGTKHLVLARDVQLHPVTDVVEHVDFLRVTDKTKIAVAVPVHFVNDEDCPGLKAGGSLNVVRHDVEMLCRANAIPDAIEVDLSSFDVGDAVKISNAVLPDGVTPVIDDRDFTLATIVAPRAMAASEDEEAEAEGGEEASAEAEGGEEAAAEGDAE